MPNTNIALIGMPGAGKSTIGVLLAKSLGMSFVDTDLLIQEKEGRLLQEIIDNDGINEFLKIEEAVILGLVKENCVIATGGSVIYSNKSMGHLKKTGRILYLELRYDEIEERIKNITTRGIAIGKSQKLIDLFNERIILYEKYADIIVNCSDLTIEDTVLKITDLVKERVKHFPILK